MTNRAPNIRSKMHWPSAVVSGSFLAGGILGCLFAALTGESSARQLHDYLSDFLSLAGEANIAIPLRNVVWSHGRWLFFCVLGICAGLAFLVIPILAAARGFLFSFGIACFVRFFGLIGLIPACVLIGMPAVFWMPGLLFIAMPGLTDRCLLRHGVAAVEDKIVGLKKLRAYFLLSILLFVLCVFLEYSLLPALLHRAANFMGYGGVSGG